VWFCADFPDCSRVGVGETQQSRSQISEGYPSTPTAIETDHVKMRPQISDFEWFNSHLDRPPEAVIPQGQTRHSPGIVNHTSLDFTLPTVNISASIFFACKAIGTSLGGIACLVELECDEASSNPPSADSFAPYIVFLSK
jgi:hypothetical protein